jgi:hypothetical protein
VDLRAGLDDLETRTFLTLPALELRPLGSPARIPAPVCRWYNSTNTFLGIIHRLVSFFKHNVPCLISVSTSLQTRPAARGRSRTACIYALTEHFIHSATSRIHISYRLLLVLKEYFLYCFR